MADRKIINVLGTLYQVDIVPEKEDHKLEDMDGYMDPSIKRIVVADVKQRPADNESVYNPEWFQKNIVRHELIHAFITESGLEDAFWHNEDMVRWLSYMFPRLLAAFNEAGALDDQPAAVPGRDIAGWITDAKGTYKPATEQVPTMTVEELRKRGFIQGCHELTTE